MSQKNPSRDKRVSKETSAVEKLPAKSNKGRKKSTEDKDLGTTIPASRKAAAAAAAKAMADAKANESSDEEFDTTAAELRAEEARLDALRARIATRDGLRYKDLRKVDEAGLQKLWNRQREASQASQKKTSKPSQVQSIGPAQRILSTGSKSSTTSSRKRKRSSSPEAKKSSGDGDHNAKKKGRRADVDKSNGAGEERDDEAISQEDDETGEEDSDEDEDDADDDDDDDKGSKKKRGKTSDFTGIVKKMVDYTTIRVCAKLAATGMFCSPQAYTSLVKKCWGHAAAEYGVDRHSSKYKLRKRHTQAIRRRVNSFRSRIRDRLKPAIATTYTLVIEGVGADEAKKRIRRWFPHAYHTRIGAPKGVGHFQHTFVAHAVFEAYYTGLNPVAIVYKHWFDPMPLPAIALVCAIIMWVIERHETGRYVPIKMTVEKLREYYLGIMDSLNAFQTGKQADRCAYVQRALYVGSLERAGLIVDQEESEPADDTLGENDFADDTPTAAELDFIARGSKSQRSNLSRPKTTSPSHSFTPKRKSRRSRSSTREPPSSPPFGRASSPVQPPRRLSTATAANEDGITTNATQADPVDSPRRHVRSSSVSLDHEEIEPEESEQGTPTPLQRPRNTATQTNAPPIDDAEKDDEDEEETQEKTDTDTEDEEEEPEVPKEKLKTKATNYFVEKLVAGSGMKKPTPKAAADDGKLKISRTSSSQRTQPRSKLKIQ